jgi:hypothetical protein
MSDRKIESTMKCLGVGRDLGHHLHSIGSATQEARKDVFAMEADLAREARGGEPSPHPHARREAKFWPWFEKELTHVGFLLGQRSVCAKDRKTDDAVYYTFLDRLGEHAKNRDFDAAINDISRLEKTIIQFEE